MIQQSNMSEFYKYRQIEKLKAIYEQLEQRKDGKEQKPKTDASAIDTQKRQKESQVKDKVKFLITNADISDLNNSE